MQRKMFILDIPRFHSTAHVTATSPRIPMPSSSSRTSTVPPRNHHAYNNNSSSSSNRTNTRRLQGNRFRALFSCMFPRSNYIHENRWDQCIQLDSRCKAISKRLIVKTIGAGGIAFDNAEVLLSNGKSSRASAAAAAMCKQISYRETKSMDSDDSLNEEEEEEEGQETDSNCFTICQKGPMKIGIPCFQVGKEEYDEKCQTSKQRISRRSVDCGQDCPICWESFKVKEKVCWSRNVNCQHGFHLDCMLVWLKDHEQCPLCRCDYMRRKY
mmetsp:Transcript_9166/g.17250  ORF Transcript_9166/g.17250 Transcript_9166/m.17250 type:complete len:269 (-) Transcript_9166:14-820(-)